MSSDVNVVISIIGSIASILGLVGSICGAASARKNAHKAANERESAEKIKQELKNHFSLSVYSAIKQEVERISSHLSNYALAQGGNRLRGVDINAISKKIDDFILLITKEKVNCDNQSIDKFINRLRRINKLLKAKKTLQEKREHIIQAHNLTQIFFETICDAENNLKFLTHGFNEKGK